MPTKPKRPCRYPSCQGFAEEGEQYCAEHQKQMDYNYNHFQREPETNKRYGRAWKRIRDRKIKENPLCEECLKNGVVKLAEEVHHVLPLSRGGTNAEKNLMALCHSCHARITVEMGDRWHDRKRGLTKIDQASQ